MVEMGWGSGRVGFYLRRRLFDLCLCRRSCFVLCVFFALDFGIFFWVLRCKVCVCMCVCVCVCVFVCVCVCVCVCVVSV